MRTFLNVSQPDLQVAGRRATLWPENSNNKSKTKLNSRSMLTSGMATWRGRRQILLLQMIPIPKLGILRQLQMSILQERGFWK